MNEDQTDAIVIVPLWTTQVWFSQLLRMLTDCPLYFNRERAALTHPHRLETELPRMTLIACNLSGKSYKNTDYLTKLRKSSCNHGDRPHLSSIKRTFKSGCNIALRGIPIHIHQL